LLTQQIPTEVKANEAVQTTVKAQVHQSSSPNRKSSFKTSSSATRKSSSPSVHSSIEYKSRKASSESNMSLNMMRNGVPPPPPMPPPLDGTDPSEVRPFLDPYGRAKTVRIGKWRWPPPQGEKGNENGEDFMHFKLRQHQRKVTPVKEQSLVVTNGHGHNNAKAESSAEWDEIDFEPIVRETERPSKVSTKRSFEIGASRPSPGSVGKLKLSSEMRQKLEKVTSNHSVRSTQQQNRKTSEGCQQIGRHEKNDVGAAAGWEMG
jgi:myosin-15